MDRRKFLFNSGLAISAGAWSGCNPKESESGHSIVHEEPALFETWDDVRKQFLLTNDKIHMSQMLLASHPKPVRDAINKHRKALDENPVAYWEGNFLAMDNKVRQAASVYMGCDPSEIALTDSTTMGLSMLYSGLRLTKEDEILTTTHDHYVTEKGLEFACAKTGATLRRVSLYTDPAKATADEMTSILKKGITNRTRIVAITYVHSSTGVKAPINQIAAMIKDVNLGRKNRIYLCVDGVHGFGIEDITMQNMECDFFSAGTHKWIFGPRGTGVLYAKKDAWNMIEPIVPSFEYNTYNAWLDLFPSDKLTFADRCSPGGFHSFEHRWALIEAFDFQLKIGKAKVQERSHTLSAQLKDGLTSISHVRLITPIDKRISAGINCFEIQGMTPEEVVKKLLLKHIIASVSPYKSSYVRLTPSIVNKEEEVLTCIKELEQLKG
ncbi:MAG: aminotransferase class V-fold PLP-dependent enzyme [Cyclobacteriaceae bacterium]|nr:aminotransferase class V-fold PLP-dependent enzyme [Cyclobacteriaceae bacterium]